MPGEELSETVKHIAKLYSEGAPWLIIYPIAVAAEASAKSCIEEARAASSKDSCKVLGRIAKAKIESPDDTLFETLKACGLTLKVQWHWVKLDRTFSYPCFHPRDILQGIAAEGHLHRILGVPVALADSVLPRFWERFKTQCPNHDLFAEPDVDFSRLIPFYLHGDGGRTYKKDPILVASMMPALGQGTARNPVELQPVPGQGVKRRRSDQHGFEAGVNLLGNSIANRFLFVAMKVAFYKEQPRRFRKLVSIWAEYMQSLFDEGFIYRGETYRVAVLGLSGDQPFLREAGFHNRSFGNIRKSETSKRFIPGCCWLCTAGRTNGPSFEDCDLLNAPWTGTVGPNNILPWTAPSPLMQLHLDPDDMAAFYLPDIFHIWHIGVGKDLSASAMIFLVTQVFATKVPAGLLALNAALAVYKSENKSEKMHCGKKLSKDLLGYVGKKSYPMGHWSKGADTTFFCKFAEHTLEKAMAMDKFAWTRSDFLMTTALRALKAIGVLFHTLHSASFWLSPEEAERVIESGHAFCRFYSSLSLASLSRNLCLYKIKPKMHMLCHLIHRCIQQYRADEGSVINFLAFSTFQSEDFVGQVSRISRRVSAKTHGVKIYHRYLVRVKRALAP